MEKNKKKPLLIPVEELASVAHNIFMIRPSEKIILNNLKEIYSDGADAGYQRRINENRAFNSKRDARIKKSADSLITYIEDSIHGGTTNKV